MTLQRMQRVSFRCPSLTRRVRGALETEVLVVGARALQAARLQCTRTPDRNLQSGKSLMMNCARTRA